MSFVWGIVFTIWVLLEVNNVTQIAALVKRVEDLERGKK